MNKTDLIEQVALKADLSKGKASEAVEAVLKTIADTLAKKEDVAILGFGTFSAEERGERRGRNPATGESMTIPATTVVKFKPGKALKDMVK